MSDAQDQMKKALPTQLSALGKPVVASFRGSSARAASIRPLTLKSRSSVIVTARLATASASRLVSVFGFLSGNSCDASCPAQTRRGLVLSPAWPLYPLFILDSKRTFPDDPEKEVAPEAVNE